MSIYQNRRITTYITMKRLIWILTSERLVTSVHLFIAVHYALCSEMLFFISCGLCFFLSVMKFVSPDPTY